MAVEDAEEAAGRLVLKTLERAGGAEALSAAHEAVPAHHGNNYRPLLDRHYRSHGSALFTLVYAIELESTSAERSVVAYLRELRNAKASHVPERMGTGRLKADGEAEAVTVVVDVDAFASAAWRKILRDKDHPGMLVRRHLEVCVLSYLAAAFCAQADIPVAGSDSYANLHDQLMSREDGRPLAAAFCAQADIPSDPAALTAARVDAGYPSSADLALEGDRPVLRRRKGLGRRPEALRLEAAIHDRLPERALLDTLTRTAYLLGWHHHFGPA